jgi:hypothetical protein
MLPKIPDKASCGVTVASPDKDRNDIKTCTDMFATILVKKRGRRGRVLDVGISSATVVK